jgi:hypothetical protein
MSSAHFNMGFTRFDSDSNARWATPDEMHWAFMNEQEKERYRRMSRNEEEAARKACADNDARNRKPHFDEAELARILEHWKPALRGAPQHGIEALHLPVQGGAVHITRQKISFETRGDAPPSPEAMRASMIHIRNLWGGKAAVCLTDKPDSETRLMQHAYAKVYGVELGDDNGPLSQAQLARLPALCSQIRAQHSDAPPDRPAANSNRPDPAQQRPA